MKKKISVAITLLIIAIFLIVSSKVTATTDFTYSLSFDKSNLTVGEDVCLELTASENMIASQFEIIYDDNAFEFVESKTAGLSARAEGGRVRCIYVDMSDLNNQVGTKKLELKFRVLSENTSISVFTLENEKYRQIGQDTSYIPSTNKVVSIPTITSGENETANTIANTIANNTTVNNTTNDIENIDPETILNNNNSGNNSIANNTIENNTIANNTTGNNTTGNNTISNNTTGNNINDETFGAVLNKDNTTNNTINNNITQNKDEKTTNQKSANPTTTTSANQKIPYAGVKENVGYVLMAISIMIILSAIFKAKETYLKNIFKQGGLMLVVAIVATTSIGSIKSYATSVLAPTSPLYSIVKFYNALVEGSNNAAIAINTKNKTSITKDEIMSLNSTITDIVNETTSLQGTDNVKTGDKIKIGTDEYIVILYGDTNADGTICDIDDIISTINHIIGSNVLTKENIVAANINNSDSNIDIDDIMSMINYHIGSLSEIVATLPEGSIDIENTVTNEPTAEHPQLLANVAQVGDIVNYPSEVTRQWQVCSIENNSVNLFCTIRLRSAPYSFYKAFSVGRPYETMEKITQLSSATGSGDQGYSESLNELKKSFNTSYAIQIRIPYTSEVTNSINSNDGVFSANNQTYAVWGTGSFVFGTVENGQYRTLQTNDIIDLRPVVQIKADIQTSGKDANGVWQLVEP